MSSNLNISTLSKSVEPYLYQFISTPFGFEKRCLQELHQMHRDRLSDLLKQAVNRSDLVKQVVNHLEQSFGCRNQSTNFTSIDQSMTSSLIQEYCKLSKALNPSDTQMNRLLEIIEMAELNSLLGSLIVEADLLMDYELSTANETQSGTQPTSERVLSIELATADEELKVDEQTCSNLRDMILTCWLKFAASDCKQPTDIAWIYQSKTHALVQEYCKLSKVLDLSDAEINRQILIMAESNSLLGRSTADASLLMDYELSTLDETQETTQAISETDLSTELATTDTDWKAISRSIEMLLEMVTACRMSLPIFKPKPSTDFVLIDQSTTSLLIQEYCKLSKVLDPSDAEMNRLLEIVEMAESNSLLGSLIVEADLLMDYELSTANETTSENLTNFKNSSSGSYKRRAATELLNC